MRTKTIVAFPLAVFAGCAVNSPSVEVVGNDADMAALAGEWIGEYENRDAGRSGRMYFRFDRPSGSAIGHVLLIPEDATGNDHPGDSHPAREYIDISVVRVAGDEIVGTLAPYQDPVCGCRLETTFYGTLRDGMIRGTFRSLHRGSVEVDEGEWWAARAPSRSRLP